MKFYSRLLLRCLVLFSSLSYSEDFKTTDTEEESTTYDIEVPILIRCSPLEEMFPGTIQVEEAPKKWKYEQEPTWGHAAYYSSYKIESQKYFHLTFKDNIYSCKPRHYESYKNETILPPVYKSAEEYINKRLGKHGNLEFYAIDEQTGFSIKLFVKTNFESGSLSFQHNGVNATCLFRKGTSSFDNSIPSLREKI